MSHPMSQHKLSVMSVASRKDSSASRKQSIVERAEAAGIDKNTIILTVKSVSHQSVMGSGRTRDVNPVKLGFR